ncbi:unnamed protein product [Prorocentrum cordatum]|uniref:RRM domain-containing protein n=1 Tax=Prorocentrum cordatum TaxID=2364126 RepID=A0ABN9P9R3_9DINO|nr:unnamed protein product [Polarella glacialis]
MGFQSKKLLEAYFARYGKVVRVMVPYSKSKRLARNLHPQARVHPGSLAFVVMADAECVGRILAASAEHGVEGYAVRVEKFQQMSGMLSDPQSESVEHACVGPREAASAARGYAVRVERFQQMSGMLSDQQSDGVEHVFAGCAPAARPPGLARRAAAPLGPAAVGPTAGWRCAGPPAAAPPFGLGVREAGTAPGYLGVGLDESLLHSPAVAAQLSDPNSVLCRLASIAREWESAAVASGENCVQAITATQVAQLQLQGLLDRCTQNLRALWLNREHSQGGAPVALDQLEGLLAEQACAAEVPPLLGVSGAAWPGGDPGRAPAAVRRRCRRRRGAAAEPGPPMAARRAAGALARRLRAGRVGAAVGRGGSPRRRRRPAALPEGRRPVARRAPARAGRAARRERQQRPRGGVAEAVPAQRLYGGPLDNAERGGPPQGVHRTGDRFPGRRLPRDPSVALLGLR